MFKKHIPIKLRVFQKIHLFFLLILNINATAQESTHFQNIKLKNDAIYLICRGTKAKTGFIAEKFNIQDRNITHVGIGYIENNTLKIFNVSDMKNLIENSLIIDSLDSFVTQDTYYLSIWKCNNSPLDLRKLKKICKKHKASKVKFDFLFNLDDDEKMYCSEFCCKVLMQINRHKYKFSPSVIKLDSFYKSVLNKDRLTYYPVDFFENNENFTKIYDSFIDKKAIKQ